MLVIKAGYVDIDLRLTSGQTDLTSNSQQLLGNVIETQMGGCELPKSSLVRNLTKAVALRPDSRRRTSRPSAIGIHHLHPTPELLSSRLVQSIPLPSLPMHIHLRTFFQRTTPSPLTTFIHQIIRRDHHSARRIPSNRVLLSRSARSRWFHSGRISQLTYVSACGLPTLLPLFGPTCSTARSISLHNATRRRWQPRYTIQRAM